MLESLVETIAGACEPARHRELLVALWELERYFDTPKQRRAAELAADALRQAGMDDVRLFEYAADGRTRWQDWTAQLAWDCPDARLSLGAEVLADRRDCPTNVVFWSGPLAETTAEVVDGDAMEPIDPAAVAGRYVLTSRPPREMKERLASARPVAVVSDYLNPTRGADEHTVKWCNTWADGPAGWYFRAADRVLPGFSLSPAAGAKLRRRLAAAGPVELTGRCEARLYAGVNQCVTGLLPGRDTSREVWLFGHACEQGAHDNASGASTCVEALTVLGRLIGEGVLPRPRCGIRVILTAECLGMLAFATEQPELLARAVAGMNIDSVGDVTDPQHPVYVHYGPLAKPSFIWPLAGELARIAAERSRGTWHAASDCEPPCSDDMIADPHCGVPTLWLGTSSDCTGYHSSADTPAVCRGVSLHAATLVAAGWAYAVAAMDNRLATAALPGMVRWMDDHMIAGSEGQARRLRLWAAGRALRDLGRLKVSLPLYMPAANEFIPPNAPPLDDLPTHGPAWERTAWGTCTLETLPPERTAGLGRWSAAQNAALCWCDGRRPPEALDRLAEAETGSAPPGGCRRLLELLGEADLAVRSDGRR